MALKPMSASNTRLHKYVGKDGAEIYAAKITAIEPFNMPGAPAGSMTLFFGELGQKRSNLIGPWVAQHSPKVGGYFVCYDVDGQTLARYEPAERIAASYSRAGAEP